MIADCVTLIAPMNLASAGDRGAAGATRPRRRAALAIPGSDRRPAVEHQLADATAHGPRAPHDREADSVDGALRSPVLPAAA